MQEPRVGEVQADLTLICDAPAGCFNATRDLMNDYFCDLARMDLSANQNLVCNGSCRALLDAVITECGNVSV